MPGPTRSCSPHRQGSPVEPDRALVRTLEPGHQSQQGGLAGAGRADDCRDAAGGHRDADARQDDLVWRGLLVDHLVLGLCGPDTTHTLQAVRESWQLPDRLTH